MAFDATAKAATATSYVTVAEADTYFGDRLNAAAWAGTPTLKKQQLLMTACSRLEQENFYGEATDTTAPQRLKWPRRGAVDPDSVEYDWDVVPRLVKEAQMELALALLNAGTTDLLADTGLEQFDSVTVGPLNVQRNKNFAGGQLPANVARLLSALRRGGTGPRIVRS